MTSARDIQARTLLRRARVHGAALAEPVGLREHDAARAARPCRRRNARAVGAAVAGLHGVAGHPLLREEIAELYEGLDKDDMLVAAPEEAIFILMNALLEPGDEVVVTWPAYQSLEEIARSIGCKVVRWQLRVESGGLDARPGGAARAHHPAHQARHRQFPAQPDRATCPTAATWDAIVQTVAARGLTLFSDEMYRVAGVRRGADGCRPLASVYEKAVTLGGLSKSFGLPGLRIGWLATRDRDLLAARERDQGLHDDLQQRAERNSGDRRPCGRGSGSWRGTWQSCGANLRAGREATSATGARSTNGCRRWPGRWPSLACSARRRRRRGPTRRSASGG